MPGKRRSTLFVRRRDLNVYYLGHGADHPGPAQTGDYILLQFLRAEAEGPQASNESSTTMEISP